MSSSISSFRYIRLSLWLSMLSFESSSPIEILVSFLLVSILEIKERDRTIRVCNSDNYSQFFTKMFRKFDSKSVIRSL